MKNIEEYFEVKENNEKFKSSNKRNKLDILLMCENENNKTIQLIQQKFNDISRKHYGDLDNTVLIENVATD